MNSIDPNSFFTTPLFIRGGKIENRLFLAPMAGLGNVAFRELVADFGGFGLLFTGMCSAKAVPTENPAVSAVFRWREQELGHTVCQIFGADPAAMGAAAERIEREGFFGVDLNFGCSAAAICKKGCGAALLKTPDRCLHIVEEVRKRVSIPVFVKFRTGWENDGANAARLARVFENAGADLLTFHPRVAPDRRTRPPNRDHIREVKQAVNIPVFGNGNVLDTDDPGRMLRETGCDGVSIGRLAVAKPWIFASLNGMPVSSENLYRNTALRMAHLLFTHFDEITAVKQFKKWVPYFASNFKFSHDIFRKLVSCRTLDSIENSVESVFQSPPEVTLRPNINLFG